MTKTQTYSDGAYKDIIVITHYNYSCYSLFLLLFLQRASLLHQFTVEMGLVSLLLLQVNAGDVASTVQLHAMLLLVATETEHQYTQLLNVPCPQYHLVLVSPVDVEGGGA